MYRHQTSSVHHIKVNINIIFEKLLQLPFTEEQQFEREA